MLKSLFIILLLCPALAPAQPSYQELESSFRFATLPDNAEVLGAQAATCYLKVHPQEPIVGVIWGYYDSGNVEKAFLALAPHQPLSLFDSIHSALKKDLENAQRNINADLKPLENQEHFLVSEYTNVPFYTSLRWFMGRKSTGGLLVKAEWNNQAVYYCTTK